MADILVKVGADLGDFERGLARVQRLAQGFAAQLERVNVVARPPRVDATAFQAAGAQAGQAFAAGLRQATEGARALGNVAAQARRAAATVGTVQAPRLVLPAPDTSAVDATLRALAARPAVRLAAPVLPAPAAFAVPPVVLRVIVPLIPPVAAPVVGRPVVPPPAPVTLAPLAAPRVLRPVVPAPELPTVPPLVVRAVVGPVAAPAAPTLPTLTLRAVFAPVAAPVVPAPPPVVLRVVIPPPALPVVPPLVVRATIAPIAAPALPTLPTLTLRATVAPIPTPDLPVLPPVALRVTVPPIPVPPVPPIPPAVLRVVVAPLPPVPAPVVGRPVVPAPLPVVLAPLAAPRVERPVVPAPVLPTIAPLVVRAVVGPVAPPAVPTLPVLTLRAVVGPIAAPSLPVIPPLRVRFAPVATPDLPRLAPVVLRVSIPPVRVPAPEVPPPIRLAAPIVTRPVVPAPDVTLVAAIRLPAPVIARPVIPTPEPPRLPPVGPLVVRMLFATPNAPTLPAVTPVRAPLDLDTRAAQAELRRAVQTLALYGRTVDGVNATAVAAWRSEAAAIRAQAAAINAPREALLRLDVAVQTVERSFTRAQTQAAQFAAATAAAAQKAATAGRQFGPALPNTTTESAAAAALVARAEALAGVQRALARLNGTQLAPVRVSVALDAASLAGLVRQFGTAGGQGGAAFVAQLTGAIRAGNVTGAVAPLARLLPDVLSGGGLGAAAAAAGVGAIGVAAAAAYVQVARLGDAQQQLAARVRLVSDNATQAGIAQTRLLQIANAAGTPYESQVRSFARLASAAKEFGASQAQALTVTQAVGQALVLGGANAQEAAAASTQLAQALGSGRLNGDELRSILEASRPLAQAIATGLGVSVGQLRDMGAAGQLTSERVFAALLQQSGQLAAQFAAFPPSFERAGQALENSFRGAIGRIDAAIGASRNLAALLNAAAQGIDSLTGAAVDARQAYAAALGPAEALRFAEFERTRIASARARLDAGGNDAGEVRRLRQVIALGEQNLRLLEQTGALAAAQRARVLPTVTTGVDAGEVARLAKLRDLGRLRVEDEQRVTTALRQLRAEQARLDRAQPRDAQAVVRLDDARAAVADQIASLTRDLTSRPLRIAAALDQRTVADALRSLREQAERSVTSVEIAADVRPFDIRAQVVGQDRIRAQLDAVAREVEAAQARLNAAITAQVTAPDTARGRADAARAVAAAESQVNDLLGTQRQLLRGIEQSQQAIARARVTVSPESLQGALDAARARLSVPVTLVIPQGNLDAAIRAADELRARLEAARFVGDDAQARQLAAALTSVERDGEQAARALLAVGLASNTITPAQVQAVEAALARLRGTSGATATNIRQAGGALQNIATAAGGILNIADAFGSIDQNTRQALQGVTGLLGGISQVQSALAALPAASRNLSGLFGSAAGITGIVGAIGGLAGIVGGLLAPSPYEQERARLTQENNAALARLSDRIDAAFLNSGGALDAVARAVATVRIGATPAERLVATGVSSSLKSAEAFLRNASAQMISAALGRAGAGEVAQLREAARAAGLSLEDLQRIAREQTGLDLLDSKGRIVAGALEALKGALADVTELMTRFGKSLDDQRALQDFLNNVRDVPDAPAQRFNDAIALLATQSAALAGQFAGIDVNTGAGRAQAEAVLRALADQIENGTITRAQLEQLSGVQDLAQLLGAADTALDAFAESTTGAAAKLTRFADGLAGQRDRFTLRDELFRPRTTDAAAQAVAAIERELAALRQLAPALSGAFDAVNAGDGLGAAERAAVLAGIRQLFSSIDAGTLTADALGQLSGVDDLTQIIRTLNTGLGTLEDAASAAAASLRFASTVGGARERLALQDELFRPGEVNAAIGTLRREIGLLLQLAPALSGAFRSLDITPGDTAAERTAILAGLRQLFQTIDTGALTREMLGDLGGVDDLTGIIRAASGALAELERAGSQAALTLSGAAGRLSARSNIFDLPDSGTAGAVQRFTDQIAALSQVAPDLGRLFDGIDVASDTGRALAEQTLRRLFDRAVTALDPALAAQLAAAGLTVDDFVSFLAGADTALDGFAEAAREATDAIGNIPEAFKTRLAELTFQAQRVTPAPVPIVVQVAPPVPTPTPTPYARPDTGRTTGPEASPRVTIAQRFEAGAIQINGTDLSPRDIYRAWEDAALERARQNNGAGAALSAAWEPQ